MDARGARGLVATVAVLAALGLAGCTPGEFSGEPRVAAAGLSMPWEVLMLPDGRTLVTELEGRVRTIAADGTVSPTPAYEDPDAVKFLGLVKHPDYAQNRFVYLYNTYQATSTLMRSRILRFRDDGERLVDRRVVFDGIGSDGVHDGGRMVFGPDGKLYVTTGDIHKPALPQDVSSLNGKILRLSMPGDDRDGGAPPDNPFASQGGSARFVWSIGHRHPQGLAFAPDGTLWESEHGPTGEPWADGERARDEVNVIVKGGNYGWPLIRGATTREGMIAPAATSGPNDTWAPSGATFGPDGHLYVSLLKGQALLDFTVSGPHITGVSVHLKGSPYKRLRAAVAGRGSLWLTTANGSTDEKVLRWPWAAG